MIATKLGCPHPRCTPNVEPTFKPVAGRIFECGNCGRLVVACTLRGCKGSGTFNRPFVRRCRRCGEEIDQAADWERARSEGWNLIPRSVGPREVIADLSSLADTSLPAPASLAMIRGALAIHQAGHYLALLKVTPGGSGSPFLWKEDEYPFPDLPDGSHPAPYPPTLLPDARHLMYSCPQGVLVLDLWSCHGLSAKDDNPRYRLIECRHRSLAAAPIPLDRSHIGLLTRGRTSDKDFRWAVWDLSRPREADAEFKARLDSVEELAGDRPNPSPLGLEGRSCRADLVDDRMVAFSTAREQRVWRKEDALSLAVEKMVRAWPSPKTDPRESIILNQEDWASVRPPRHAFLLPTRGARHKFSWFVCVQQDDADNPEPVKQYDVEFDTIQPPSFPVPIGLPSGAVPIGPAPNQDGNLQQMYFRVGTEIWVWTDGLGTSRYEGGLPKDLVSLRLSGPLVVSVEEKDRGQRSIQIDSLHHRAGHVPVPVEDKLLSEQPLLWHHWLFTIELDVEGRLQAYRRTVTFEKPETKA